MSLMEIVFVDSSNDNKREDLFTKSSIPSARNQPSRGKLSGPKSLTQCLPLP